MSHSTAKRQGGKAIRPAKPRPDFPLFPHATKRWAKKIRGKLHYFGPWDDPKGALEKYLVQKDDLHAGRTPRISPDELTIRELSNRFLTSKKRLLETGEIVHRTFVNHHTTCRVIGEFFGFDRPVSDLRADDFERLRVELARTRSALTLKVWITRVKVLFKYGYDAGLIDNPMRYGPAFKGPSKRLLQEARNTNGVKMFEADQLRLILEEASLPMRAMTLLAVNCGFGNHDLGALPLSALDLDSGWANYPRPKTAIPRRCPLWPETVKAVQAFLEVRPEPEREADRGFVFVTRPGRRWVRMNDNGTWVDSIRFEFRKMLARAGLTRRGVGFYALRHTFETIAGDSKDQVAVDSIMGHSDSSMAAVYRERISDERLRAVVDHVRAWLFGEEERQ